MESNSSLGMADDKCIWLSVFIWDDINRYSVGRTGAERIGTDGIPGNIYIDIYPYTNYDTHTNAYTYSRCGCNDYFG